MPGLFDRLQSEIEQRERTEGLSPADLLDLSPELRKLVQTLTRQGDMTAARLGAAVAMPASEVTPLLEALIAKGFVGVIDGGAERRYKAVLARRRGREVPFNIWEALTDRVAGEDSGAGSPPGTGSTAGSTPGTESTPGRAAGSGGAADGDANAADGSSARDRGGT